MQQTDRARVIADSISPAGKRLTTMEVRFHRFVLAEFNTHRDFSRNSASSRAIPVAKQLQRVFEDPAMPVEWGQNQAGMQAGAELESTDKIEAQLLWLDARDKAVAAVEQLTALGLHKQVANRLLEPFMWHTVIVTATEWDNFFKQRCSPLAQPEIRVVAEAMRSAYNTSEPKLVGEGGWHLPYLREEDFDWAVRYAIDNTLSMQGVLKRLSVARCARVSYLTHDGLRDPVKDLDLYFKLIQADPMHASPLEHVATPVKVGEIAFGNFRGWRQHRHEIQKPAVKLDWTGSYDLALADEIAAALRAQPQPVLLDVAAAVAAKTVAAQTVGVR